MRSLYVNIRICEQVCYIRFSNWYEIDYICKCFVILYGFLIDWFVIQLSMISHKTIIHTYTFKMVLINVWYELSFNCQLKTEANLRINWSSVMVIIDRIMIFLLMWPMIKDYCCCLWLYLTAHNFKLLLVMFCCVFSFAGNVRSAQKKTQKKKKQKRIR